MESLTERFLKIAEALVVLDQQSGALPVSVKLEIPPVVRDWEPPTEEGEVAKATKELQSQMQKIEDLFAGVGVASTPRDEDLALND